MRYFSQAGWLCPLFFVVFFIVVIITIIRAVVKSASRGSKRPRLVVPTQLGQDGFWIVSCAADPGSLIYYDFWSGGARYSGQVPFKPEPDGRQFVYTGRQPDQASVSRIVNVGDDLVIPPVIVVGSTWDPPDTPSAPSPPFFPSAY